jgi:hypothetical protein
VLDYSDDPQKFGDRIRALTEPWGSFFGIWRLDGYHYQPADTIDLIGEDGTRLVLLVVPATTDPRVAASILSAAADSHDISTTSELLALRTENTVEAGDSIAAQQNWESEGGTPIRVPDPI